MDAYDFDEEIIYETVPVPNVNNQILKLVVQWCQ